MPTIRGQKMACEPCIRGHRSTKCTHADERLMVPVRKPGRPLSACPHPKGQECGCGGITAAIPRRQTCGCGSNIPAAAEPPQTGPTDVPSPTRVTFKVAKQNGKPQSSRKQSFDRVNLERMDIGQVNILPYEQRSQSKPMPLSNDYTAASPPQIYGFSPQYTNIQSQFGHAPIQPLHLPPASMIPPVDQTIHNGLRNVIGSPSATPINSSNGGEKTARRGSCCGPVPNTVQEDETTVGSCCAPKLISHNHNLSNGSSISEPTESKVESCCSSNNTQQISERKPFLNGSIADMTPQLHQMALSNGIPTNPVLYPHVFTYPPTYGSYSNPLQPSEWKQSVQAMNYVGSQVQQPVSLPFDAPPLPDLNTIHTCTCGETCECVGCAAHPYNNATQDYVRRAWSSMNHEQLPPAHTQKLYTNEHRHSPTMNDTSIITSPSTVVPAQNNDNAASSPAASSPTAHTPTVYTPTAHTPTSANGEEQPLSEDDYFFMHTYLPALQLRWDDTGFGGESWVTWKRCAADKQERVPRGAKTMSDPSLYVYPSPLEGYEETDPLPDDKAEDGKSYVNPQTGVLSKSYEVFVEPLDNGIRGAFDVHIYHFQKNPEQSKFARELWERIRREFPELRIYRFWEEPIGPHPIAMFEVNLFTPAQFGAFIPWLIIHRGPLSVLVHPNTINPVTGEADEAERDHTQRATWMGEKIILDLSIFKTMATRKAALEKQSKD
ncbi:hypothetical protein B7494_g2203 [Chlorociboria aeruginascens]|nr:hypothetical protein B7494_g2203 [Chlorociboria aeruginascens]